jgi:peptidoglycan-N-acetylglucosamine deacetylase
VTAVAAKTASIHIDMDSPATLLRFWGFDGRFDDPDQFHERAMTRALNLLRRCGVRATFFCIGEELEQSPVAAAMVRQAHREGHEIANHTYSHPFGLGALDAATIRREIADCSQAIRRVTGVAPTGFRAPGYAINGLVLDIAEELGLDYDSSAFWNTLHPAMKVYRQVFGGRSPPASFGEASMGLPRAPYHPARRRWTRRGPARPIVEIPLPRTRILGLPFYSTFHLAAGALYRAMATALMRQPHVVYLVHLVEFVDLGDGLPAALAVHPGLSTATTVKMQALEATIATLKKRYRVITSAEIVRTLRAAGEAAAHGATRGAVSDTDTEHAWTRKFSGMGRAPRGIE